MRVEEQWDKVEKAMTEVAATVCGVTKGKRNLPLAAQFVSQEHCRPPGFLSKIPRMVWRTMEKCRVFR